MVDQRDPAWPVRDQGQRGTCVAFAGTGAHEWLRARDTDLSEEFLHWAAKARDGLPPGTDGTTLAAMVAGLADVGQSTAILWPYDERADDTVSNYGPSPGALADAAGRRLAPAGSITPSPEAVQGALDDGALPVIGIALFDTWFQAAADGRISLPDSSMSPLGGHAVAVVGYRGPSDAVEFIVRNSWGADWGDGGHGYLPAAYVERFGLAAVRLALPKAGLDG